MKSRTSQQRRWRLRALTLIEMLAVVCLVALAAVLTLTGLGAASADAQLRAALSECRQFDARLRLLARADGPVMITVTDEGHLLRAGHAGGGETTAPMMRVLAPSGWSVRLLDSEGNPISQLLIDARGCSDDYMLELRAEEGSDGSPESRRLRVAGLTGWVDEVHEP